MYRTRVDYLLAKKIDMILARMVTTPERLTIVDASIPYLRPGGGTLMAPKDGPVTSWETTRGHDVCANESAYLNSTIIGRFGARIIEFSETELPYQALAAGRCAAYAFDEILARLKAKDPQWTGYAVVGEPLQSNGHHIGVRKNDEEFLAQLDRLILQAQAEGRMIRWEKQYGRIRTPGAWSRSTSPRRSSVNDRAHGQQLVHHASASLACFVRPPYQSWRFRPAGRFAEPAQQGVTAMDGGAGAHTELAGSGFKGRREDGRLLTGQGCYTADMNKPGQVHGAFLRADRAHALIESVDTAAARAAPGVLAVLTAEDMAEAGYTRGQAFLPFKGRDGQALKTPRSPALAHGRVRFVGEAVAVVVAEAAHQAQDATELIDVRYATLDTVVDPRAALEPGAPQLHDGVPGNLAFDFAFGDDAAIEATFVRAAHVVRLEHGSNRVVGNPMEPKAALLDWDGDVLEMWSSSQGMTGMRLSLATLTGLPEERVRVHAQDVGGAFGIRGHAYPEYAALALGARRVGRPVQWVASRSETFLSDYHGRAVHMVAELALDADGTFLAIRHDWVCDLGGHPSAAGAVTNTLNAALMATGAYRIPVASGRIRLAVTNTVPITAYRGAGRPDAAFIVERLVEQAARQTGLDRQMLRRRNFIARDAFPYPLATAPMPAAYDSADFALLLDRAEAEADWQGFPARRAEAATRGKLRGIGCAVFIEPAGGVSPTDEALITFEPGGAILLHEVAVASGQGHETVFPELVGRVLQVDPARITLVAGRADGPALKGGGAFGSRSLMSMGSVSVEAAGLVLRKGLALAADALEAAEADIAYADGTFRIVGTDRTVALMELARRHPGALDSKAELKSPVAFPSGAHVAEVEIDPETGTTELVRYTSVDDCGTVVNETLVEGQIWGGLLQGLGQVLGESCVYDADGQMMSGSFMDYAMPHADLAKAVTIRLLSVPSPTNQLGAKGVGEAGTVGALPTAMNAILDALRPAGVTHLEMPASAHRVWEAINSSR